MSKPSWVKDDKPTSAPKQSKRWSTTTESGLAAIVERRNELEDRGVIAARMRDRKLANTQTSIRFGFDEDDWQTEAQMRQKDILAAKPRDILGEKKKMHDMKMHLKFHTNISFGDEPVDYTQDSKMEDPTGNIGSYTGKLNREVEKFIKQSNLYFGNEKPIWKSQAHTGMEDGLVGDKADGLDYVKLQEDIKVMKKELRASNFDFGDDKIDYTTDHQRGYKQYSVESMKDCRGELAQDQKADLRMCHFEFGHDKPEYETDMMGTTWKIGENIMNGAGENPAKERARAKQLKLELQRTSFIIGDNADYM